MHGPMNVKHLLIKLVLSVKHTFIILFNVLFGRHVSTFYLVIIRPFT